MDRLLDTASEGTFQIVAVLSPDRLDRKYAHQVLLLGELSRAGCHVVFIQRPVSDDPNDQLLLQIQGAIAEYERALMGEPFRRGKLPKARNGQIIAGLESRVTILGYLRRGGIPSAGDRLLATRLGTACAHLINRGTYGVVVAAGGDGFEPVPLKEIVGRRKTVALDHFWINSPRSLGTETKKQISTQSIWDYIPRIPQSRMAAVKSVERTSAVQDRRLSSDLHAGNYEALHTVGKRPDSLDSLRDIVHATTNHRFRSSILRHENQQTHRVGLGQREEVSTCPRTGEVCS